MNKNYIISVLESNGIDENYFESMGGREIEYGGNEWVSVVEEVGEDKIMEFIGGVENELNIEFI